jgi:23S rRNA pseudouridine955/2504/2580 synthase
VQAGDRVRIPPVRTARPARTAPGPVAPLLTRLALFEDEWLLALNKPAGVAAHGGSGISRGVIEQMRLERPELRFLELAHRLDRDTSGVLLLAKKRSALTALHAQMRAGSMRKWYLVLIVGRWRDTHRDVQLPLSKFVTAAGERRVSVERGGLPSRTLFHLRRTYPGFALLAAELRTGRTHQIRVHLQHLGFPIAGDEKYGDFALNRTLAKQGLKRMFLHADAVEFAHPASGEPVHVQAPLASDLQAFLDRLERPGGAAADNDG